MKSEDRCHSFDDINQHECFLHCRHRRQTRIRGTFDRGTKGTQKGTKGPKRVLRGLRGPSKMAYRGPNRVFRGQKGNLGDPKGYLGDPEGF